MSTVAELIDELARKIDADREDLAVAVDRVRTAANPRRRAYDAIGSPLQTTLQGYNRADVLRADGGEPNPDRITAYLPPERRALAIIGLACTCREDVEQTNLGLAGP